MHVIMANNTAGGIILTKTDSKTVYAPDMPATCHSYNDSKQSEMRWRARRGGEARGLGKGRQYKRSLDKGRQGAARVAFVAERINLASNAAHFVFHWPFTVWPRACCCSPGWLLPVTCALGAAAAAAVAA